MNPKIDKKQYLRYMKTFVWAMSKPMDELLQINKKGVLNNYPVDAKTVEDAINYVETGDGLRTTKVSMTDVYALMEVMKHKENELNEKQNESNTGI
jgi:predicted regulator of amino acid metabolism with ACT domain